VPRPPPAQVKTTYEPGCPFLGAGADLILGTISNLNEGINPDGTFVGCTIVAQVRNVADPQHLPEPCPHT